MWPFDEDTRNTELLFTKLRQLNSKQNDRNIQHVMNLETDLPAHHCLILYIIRKLHWNVFLHVTVMQCKHEHKCNDHELRWQISTDTKSYLQNFCKITQGYILNRISERVVVWSRNVRLCSRYLFQASKQRHSATNTHYMQAKFNIISANATQNHSFNCQQTSLNLTWTDA